MTNKKLLILKALTFCLFLTISLSSCESDSGTKDNNDSEETNEEHDAENAVDALHVL